MGSRVAQTACPHGVPPSNITLMSARHRLGERLATLRGPEPSHRAPQVNPTWRQNAVRIAFVVAVASGIVLRRRYTWVGLAMHIYGQIAIWLSLFVMSLAALLFVAGA